MNEEAVTEVQEEVSQAEVEVQAEETPSMDELLAEATSEFDKGMETDTTEVEPSFTDGDTRVDEMYSAHQVDQQRKTTTDIESAVGIVKGVDESLNMYPDEMVNGYLHSLAAKDPRFVKAFQFRHQNPGTWEKVLKTVGTDLAKGQSVKQEPSIANDLASVRSAINTTNTKTEGPTDADILAMNPTDFEQYKVSIGLDSSDDW
jgi:hypothetical protein